MAFKRINLIEGLSYAKLYTRTLQLPVYKNEQAQLGVPHSKIQVELD